MRRADAAIATTRVAPPGSGEVFKRDGRREAFDRGKLARCLAEALDASGEAVDGVELGEAFADVVHRALVDGGEGRVWATHDVAQLAVDVLEASGCRGAAQAWRAVDRARRRWRAPGGADDAGSFTKGRLVHWMADGERVARPVADDVAASVERRLFAAGLSDPGEALLRAWVDDELARRGERHRVGAAATGPIAGPTPEALRRLLADRRPGDDVLRTAGAALLGAYAAREIHAPAVLTAHERGHLELGDLVAPARVQRVVVPELLLDAARLTALRAVSAEPVVVLVGPGDAWRGLLPLERGAGLADVELLVADEVQASALLEVVVTDRAGGLRGGAVAASLGACAGSWARAIDVRDTLRVWRDVPPVGVVEHGVAINAAGLALDAGGDVDGFVAALTSTARLADDAIAARAGHAGPPAWPDASAVAAAAAVDLPSLGAERALAGLDVAYAWLDVTTPRAAVRLGRRIAAALAAPSTVCPRATLHRFGTRDLERHPDARERWTLDASRARFAYDVPRTTGGPLAARLAARLLAPASPWPRGVDPGHVFPRPSSSPTPTPRPCA